MCIIDTLCANKGGHTFGLQKKNHSKPCYGRKGKVYINNTYNWCTLSLKKQVTLLEVYGSWKKSSSERINLMQLYSSLVNSKRFHYYDKIS